MGRPDNNETSLGFRALVGNQNMRKYKVGDHVQVKLSGGRLVEADVKAIRETSEGVRLQVSWGEETALIYLWQVVEEAR